MQYSLCFMKDVYDLTHEGIHIFRVLTLKINGFIWCLLNKDQYKVNSGKILSAEYSTAVLKPFHNVIIITGDII